MPEENGSSNVEIKTGFGSVALNSKKMAEIISVALICVVGIMGYILWDHSMDARAAEGEFKKFLETMSERNTKALEQATTRQAQMIEKLVETQKQNIEAQREMNCLISLPQEERRKEFIGENSFCKRMSRIQ